MDTYARFEALSIHLLTGALFAVISGLFLWQAAAHSIALLLLTLVVTAAAAYGWWLQATFFAAILRGRDPDIRL
jgi:hypothetical protein